jgi:hypothetical protein
MGPGVRQSGLLASGMRKMRFFGAALMAALACAGNALAATYTLHGNAKGMRLAERVIDAFAKVPGYTYTETQFFQMTTTGGKSPSLHYRFGYGSLRAGWTWASEKGAMKLSNNHIVWWRDDLAPASKRAQPVEIVFNGNGKFWAFGSSSHHGCFRPLSSQSEMPYERGFSITGKVDAPRKQSGGSVSLTYTYPWYGASGSATESDTIKGSNDLVDSGVVAAGGHNFGFANFFTGPGAAPDVKLCK